MSDPTRQTAQRLHLLGLEELLVQLLRLLRDQLACLDGESKLLVGRLQLFGPAVHFLIQRGPQFFRLSQGACHRAQSLELHTGKS